MRPKTLARRSIALGALGAGLLALAAVPVYAQTYPDKPVRIIVPFAAGGGVDNITRVVAQHLGARLKQPIVIENRVGANANIGTDAVATAAPDGYTLLMGATYLAYNRATSKSVPYDALHDLAPVARTGKAPFILAVPVSSPARSVAELVAFMKANPQQSSYGAVGAGQPPHLLFVRNTGTTPVQVLYKGGAAAMPDLITGRLTYMIQTASEIVPQVAAGKLRALAVTGSARFKALPDVPTMREAGVPDLEGTGWWGLFAPAKTPSAVVERLSAEVVAVMRMPEVVTALERMGIDSAPMPTSEFTAFYRNELHEFAKVAREFNLTSE